MKLQTRYSLTTIISSISVLLIAGIGYYFLLHYILTEQLDEALRVEEVEILDYINKKHGLPEATTYKDQRINFEMAMAKVPRRFSTIYLYEPEENEYEWSRQLVFTVNVKGQYYAAYVSISQEKTERLSGLILLITLGLIFLLGGILFFFNRFLLKRLWRPFYANLSSIKRFDINAPSAIEFPNTSVDEFNEMNRSVSMMTEKVIKDYMSLKNFTDHASHEIQTPLAVITSKLDVLIQDTELSESILQQIQSIYISVDKISRLCQSLLLLTKIEINQFSDAELVNLKQLVEGKMKELEEWIHASGLQIKTDLSDMTVTMNRQLADILCSNLIINALKHSNTGEEIIINLKKPYFEIGNPADKALDTGVIFDRFWKSAKSQGSGLGLAIVNHICTIYEFNLSYDYREGRHYFRVVFK